ncbi:hypothetical protein [Equine parapoxvirus]|nr:hypothetical protein [Equine parapoxvirus]
MLLYPKKARDAAAALRRKGLCASKLSAEQLRSLLAVGLHGDLPMGVYDEAVAASPLNVAYFPPQHVRVPDLALALKEAGRVPKKLMPAVCLHKRELLGTGDRGVLQAMLAAGVVYSREVSELAESGAVPAVLALTCAPWTASGGLKLSRTEIETVCRAISPDLAREMIPKLRIEPADLVAICDATGVPPLNPALARVSDPETCARLVCQWPCFNVLKFVAPEVARSKAFAAAVREGAMALCVRPVGADRLLGISRAQSRRLPEERLHVVYEVSPVASDASSGSSWSVRSDPCSEPGPAGAPAAEDGAEEAGAAGTLARRFTMHSVGAAARASPSAWRTRPDRASIGPLLRARPPASALAASAAGAPRAALAARADAAEELIAHLSAEWERGRRPAPEVLRRLLADFRADPTFPRTMLSSDAPKKLKRKMLKAVCAWPAVGEPSSAAMAAVECAADQAAALVLCNYRHICAVMAALSKPPLPPACGCALCESLSSPCRPALRSASFSAGAIASPELDDAALLAAVADAALLAMHGVVDPSFAGSVAWGPLSGALCGARSLDAARLLEALSYERLVFCNVSNEGIKNTNALLRLARVSVPELAPGCSLLNHDHARALVAVGCVAEYILAAIFFRATVLRRTCKVREFAAQVVGAVLEATGTVAPTLKVHDRVEREVLDLANGGASVPLCAAGVALRVAHAVFENFVENGSH